MKKTALALLIVPALAFAQEREDRTLLTQAQMTAIINEVSGDRAMHHLLELVPYQRVRLPDEYNGPYRESQVMAKFAKEYGFANVTIETYGTPTMAWQPTQGELWMTTPKSSKLFDIHDVALSLASLNANGDFTGELVDVGAGRAHTWTRTRRDCGDSGGRRVEADRGSGPRDFEVRQWLGRVRLPQVPGQR